MTAVEKIIAEINNELQTLESLHGKEIFGRKVGLAFAKRVAEQAKEMEKEQSNAKIQKAIEVFEEAKSKAITIKDMFYYLDIVLVALEGIKNETFKSE